MAKGLLALSIAAALQAQGGALSADPAKKPPGNNTRGRNALVLYELAVEQFEPCLEIPLPVVRHGPFGIDPKELEKLHEAESKRYDSSVVARSLFAQATRMPHCRFGVERFQGKPSFLAKLDKLAECVDRHSWRTFEEQPEQATEAVCTLLRYRRHLRQGCRHLIWSTTLRPEWLTKEMQTLQLLARVLRERKLRPGWPERAATVHAELDLLEAESFPTEHIVTMCRAFGQTSVERYCAEMRKDEGEAPAERALLAQVRELLPRILLVGEQQPQTLRGYLQRVAERERKMVAAAEEGDYHALAVVREILKQRSGFALLRRLDRAAQECRKLLPRREAGKVAPRDDAIVLYRLFVEEVERAIELPLIQPKMTRHGPDMMEDLEREKAIQKARDRGVVARDLFRQAVNRSQCTFPPDAEKGDDEFGAKLRDAAYCVMRHGDGIVKRDPAGAAEIAGQMLRFAQHLRVGLATQANAKWLREWAYMRELRALQLLVAALEELQGKASLHVLTPRIRPELARVRARQPEMVEIVQAVYAAVPEMVQKYAAELEQPSEQDRRWFAAETRKLVEFALGPAEERADLATWLQAVEQRRTKHVDADVTSESDSKRLVRKAANQALRTKGIVRRAHFLLRTEARCRALLAPEMGPASRR